MKFCSPSKSLRQDISWGYIKAFQASKAKALVLVYTVKVNARDVRIIILPLGGSRTTEVLANLLTLSKLLVFCIILLLGRGISEGVS